MQNNRHAARIAKESEAFLGELRGKQVGFFLLLFTLWFVANAVNISFTLHRLFDLSQNTKVLTSQKRITDVYLNEQLDSPGKYLNFQEPFPRFAIVMCAKQLQGGSVKATQYLAHKTLWASQPYTTKKVLCRNFDRPSKFNDYGGLVGVSVPCCGVEVPRGLLLGLTKEKELDDDKDATTLRPISPEAELQFKVSGINVGFIGVFISPMKEEDDVESSLDPRGFETSGAAALFNDRYHCEQNKTKTVIGTERVTYSAIEMTRRYDQRSLFSVLARLPPPTTTGTFHPIQSRNTFKETDLPCECVEGGRDCVVASQNMTYSVVFFAPFQKTEMTDINVRNNFELTDGLGSCFGLLMSTMWLWNFFFPAKPKLDPGVRRPHKCWYLLFPYWAPASTDSNFDHPESESSETTRGL